MGRERLLGGPPGDGKCYEMYRGGMASRIELGGVAQLGGLLVGNWPGERL